MIDFVTLQSLQDFLYRQLSTFLGFFGLRLPRVESRFFVYVYISRQRLARLSN